MTLATDLQTTLGKIATSAAMVKMPGQLSKIYEIWILFNLAERLKQKKWQVEIRGHNDAPVTRFRQRGNPGFIHPASATAPKPSFVLLTRPGDNEQFELHNSVRFAGRSSALHEFDVFLIARTIGNSLRAAQQKRAAVGHPMLSIECKYYSGTASIGVPRAVIGTLYDTTHWNRHALEDRGHLEGGDVIHCTSLKDRLDYGFPAVISPRKFTPGAKNLANAYKLRLFPRIKVGSSQLVTFLDQAELWLTVYPG